MKINIDQPIMNFEGKPIKEGQPDKEAEVTFRSIIQTALNVEDNEHRLTAEKKLFSFQIGTKLFNKKLKEYDLTTDQIGFLKERIGIFFGSVVYGRFCELIGDIKTDPAE